MIDEHGEDIDADEGDDTGEIEDVDDAESKGFNCRCVRLLQSKLEYEFTSNSPVSGSIS
jgi:hypothetical protein